jgi:predicted Ser/Thr protein kinase
VALQSFGKYRVFEKIGQGAMGEVYRARDGALNRDVALKTITAGDSGDEMLQKRFQREAQSAAGLAHPNIITVFDFGQEQGRLYMAMELLDGRDLKAAIADGSLRTLDEKLAVVEQIACGLAFAHENGVVHRDLKPANIHIPSSGQVKIVDFGLARMTGSDMTRSGMVMGTPHYMSPEQVRGERADTRSDVFSLGCILYELLTGAKPFDADSMHAVLFKVLQEAPRDVRTMSPEVPLVVVQVLEVALAKKPDDRFKDAGAFLTALQAARIAIDMDRGEEPLPDLPIPAAPAGRDTAKAARAAEAAADRSSWLLLAAGAAVALLLVVAVSAGFWFYQNAQQPAIPPPSSQQVALAKALAANQLELARKRLDARDYAEALRQAERAQSLDPHNLDAIKVKQQAQQAIALREDAARAAHESAAKGDRDREAESLWKLMQLEPTHPAVAELAPDVDKQLKDHATEARTKLVAARATAEKANLGAAAEYQDSSRLLHDADAAAKEGHWATAAAHLLDAQDRLNRLLPASH